MPARNTLPPFPNGWFVYSFADELSRGDLLARPFMGQGVVVYRTQSGQAIAVDAYCPHLGAHCAADTACAHRKELFQPVRRTTFY